MITHSQAGQDRFVHALLPHRDGTFIDIGCSHPVELSNTYALEAEMDWRGILMDSCRNSIELCLTQRKSIPVCDDATKFDWEPVLRKYGRQPVDYCSLDTDEAQVNALQNLLRAADVTGTRFRVMTVETDRYRFGDIPREQIYSILSSRGYALIADDVKSNGCAFESWWVDPDLVDMERANKFKSAGMDWADVLRQGGVKC